MDTKNLLGPLGLGLVRRVRQDTNGWVYYTYWTQTNTKFLYIGGAIRLLRHVDCDEY